MRIIRRNAINVSIKRVAYFIDGEIGMGGLISAIIPVYNTSEEYLRECIKSIAGQTYQHYEVLLVDDGSAEETAHLCDQLADEYSGLRVIHQPNGGPSAARNTGIREIRGDYLTFVDSDDTLQPATWEVCIKNLEESFADCIVFGWINNAIGNTTEKKVADQGKYAIPAEETIVQIASDNEACGGGYPWNKIWRVHSVRQNNNGRIPEFDPALFTYEDKEWVLRMLLGAGSVVFLPDVLYNYRFVPSSMTNAADNWYRRQYNAYAAYDSILNLLQDRNTRAYRGAANFYFRFGMHDLLEQYRHPSYYGGIARGRKTKHCMYALCKRLQFREMGNWKAKVAWVVMRVWGKV